MDSYDVIVVGAGPAGLYACKELARTGTKYILIDSKSRIGHPLKCAEGVNEESFKEFFGHKKYNFIMNRVNYHKIIYQDLERSLKVNFLQLDRPGWEQWMSKGLKIRLNCRLIDLNIQEEYAELITSQGILRAKLVILCNGCNFNIQKKFSLVKKNPVIAIAYGGIYKNYGLASNAFYYYFDEEFYGYLWIFPKSEKIANIGMAYYPVPGKKLNPRIMFKKFLKKYGFNVKPISNYSGIIPCSGPIYRTYHDRLLVCGDAAGLLYAGTGEGIKYALKSGKIAAMIANESLKKKRFDKKFLKRYENAWKKDFGKEMKSGLLFFDLTVAATRTGKVKGLFSAPTEQEIKGLVLQGKFPFKAWLGWKICKTLGWTKLENKRINI